MTTHAQSSARAAQFTAAIVERPDPANGRMAQETYMFEISDGTDTVRAHAVRIPCMQRRTMREQSDTYYMSGGFRCVEFWREQRWDSRTQYQSTYEVGAVLVVHGCGRIDVIPNVPEGFCGNGRTWQEFERDRPRAVGFW